MSDLFLARAIHFDESDRNVFHAPARTGEWCVSGGFEFSNWSEGDLTGKARQAFAKQFGIVHIKCDKLVDLLSSFL